ncbi:MAG: ribonuclease H family protein [Eubacteriales bacterium]|nr:ribonuclease H family protein [Eubacteriales bacterium]
MAKKYYAVKQGRTPGVYQTWAECKAQVDGYSGAVYKSFPTFPEALAFVTGVAQSGAVQGDGGTQENDRRAEPSRTVIAAESATRETDALIAYVDGSYHSVTKEFSYGVVILQGGKEYCFQEKLSDPSLAGMRNVAGEIKGAEAAMRYAVEHGHSKITIYHDYEGIARWCTGDWKANKPGTQAYKAYFDSICDQVQVSFIKVKGHSGDKYNDMADHLAKQALGITG